VTDEASLMGKKAMRNFGAQKSVSHCICEIKFSLNPNCKGLIWHLRQRKRKTKCQKIKQIEQNQKINI